MPWQKKQEDKLAGKFYETSDQTGLRVLGRLATIGSIYRKQAHEKLVGNFEAGVRPWELCVALR